MAGVSIDKLPLHKPDKLPLHKPLVTPAAPPPPRTPPE